MKFLLAAITFNQPQWLWPAAGILAAAVLILAFRYGRATGASPGARLAAAALRLLGIGFLCLCLLDVQWTTRRAEKGANYFLVLADKSRGMHIRDRGASETRAETLGALLRRDEGTTGGRGGEWQEALEGAFQVRRYVFGDRLESADSFEDLVCDGASSNLGKALKLLRERYRNRPLAGILLLSDGNATDLESPTELAFEKSGEGPPIFPVVIGKGEPAADLAITAARVSQTIFEDAPVTIDVDVRATGFEGREVTLRLLDEAGEEVEQKSRRVAGEDETHRFRLRMRPAKSGVLFYTLELGANEGSAEGGAGQVEATEENNRRVVLVERPRGPYRILYVTGRPNWEYKYLRRALAVDPQVDMVGLIRVAKREPKFEWRGRSGESSNPLFRGFAAGDPEESGGYDKPVLIRLNTRDAEELRDGFPGTAEELFANYQALILDDVEAEFFTSDQMQLIEEFVSRRGGGFIMLGGQESYRGGAYENTPVAQLLPVYLDRIPTAEYSRPLRMELTREGWLEPWLRLRDVEEEEARRLEDMPGFKVLNQVRAIKPGASVFASALDEGQRSFPAIVAQRFGEGRVLAVTVGDVWRWGSRDEDARADMDKAWRQMARWVLADVPDRVSTTVAREKVESAARTAGIEVRVRDKEFFPEDNAVVTVEITGADGEGVEHVAEPSVEEAGLYEVEVAIQEEGNYRVTATARDESGEVIGAGEAGWAVDPAVEEFRRLRPDRELLEGLARRSGGEMVAADSLKRFADQLPQREAPVMELRADSLWHTPWMFLGALMCFIMEWALRRRHGMV